MTSFLRQSIVRSACFKPQPLAHHKLLSIRAIHLSSKMGFEDHPTRSWETEGESGILRKSLGEVETEGELFDNHKSDEHLSEQSNDHQESNATRLEPPQAHKLPEYRGEVLPFRLTAVGTKLAGENTSPSIGYRHYDLESMGTGLNSTRYGVDPFLPVIPGNGLANPEIFEDIASLRTYRHHVAQRGYTVGFVPTMGALHQGHLDLMQAAAEKCSEVWVSIYVNPTQFGANEDLSTYPSTWNEDLEKIKALNRNLLTDRLGRVSAIFRPRSPEILYPYGVEATSHVIINPELTQILEGSSRPTFFRGVTTVVMKLLNIVQPDRVFFGQKDFQQFAVIKRMINEFHLPVRIERVPTTREASGLAMSSRNAYLGERRLLRARLLHRMLSVAKDKFQSVDPDRRTRKLLIDAAMVVYDQEKSRQDRNAIAKPYAAVPIRLDYLSLADPDTLIEIPDLIGPNGAVMSLAIYFDPLKKENIHPNERLGINGDSTSVRLIDNELIGGDQGHRLQTGQWL